MNLTLHVLDYFAKGLSINDVIICRVKGGVKFSNELMADSKSNNLVTWGMKRMKNEEKTGDVLYG